MASIRLHVYKIVTIGVHVLLIEDKDILSQKISDTYLYFYGFIAQQY